ncbi:MAG: hypothetical protein HRT73_06495, partial [Flavobacteriales bacterium]|nr:hypothetical protein [Flavobacteriales bacterium]
MKNHLLKYKLHYFLFILAFGIYANTISHDYAWDDAIVITTNDRVQKGFEGIPELIYNFKSEETQHRYGYRPITLATYAIEVGFFGLNPQVSHFNNVLLFALLCVLLFYSIHKIFPDKGKYFAFFVTLIFVVHPLHVEVVANIKSRDEILALLFGLLAINSFINYLKKEIKKYINLAFTMLFVVLAFLCKENAATLVGVLVLLIWFLLDVSFKQLLLKSMPVAVIVFAILMIRYWSYSEGVFFDTSIDSLAKGIYGGQDMAGNMLFNYDFGVVLVNSFYISVYYFKLFLFPINLVHDYGTAYVDVVSFSDLVAIFAIVFHLGLLTYMVKTIKKKTPFHFGMLFYFITIFIYLHVLKVGPDYMAERFMFIPSIGLSIVP